MNLRFKYHSRILYKCIIVRCGELQRNHFLLLTVSTKLLNINNKSTKNAKSLQRCKINESTNKCDFLKK